MKKFSKLLSLILVFAMLSVYAPVITSAAESYLWPVPKSTNNPAYSSTLPGLNIRGGDDIVAVKSGTVIYAYSGCRNNSALTTKVPCSSAGCSPNHGFYTNKDYSIKLCNWGYGNGFVLQHSDGTGYSFYGHMGSINVSSGSVVKQGDVVGKMGGSGLTFNENLYFAVASSYKKSGTYYSPVSPVSCGKSDIAYFYVPSTPASFTSVSSSAVTSSSITFNCGINLNSTYAKSLYLALTKNGTETYYYVSDIVTGGSYYSTYSKQITGLSPSTEYEYRFVVRFPGHPGDGEISSAKYKVTTTPVQPESVSLNKTSLELKVGESAVLTASVLPSDASQTVTWVSSDSSVASVSDGTVTAKSTGIIIITASTANGKTANCTVSVTAPAVPATGVSLNKTSLTLTEGDTAVLSAALTPAGSTDSVSWSSSDNSVVTVSEGNLTAKKPGSAVITVKTGSGKTAACNVTVKKKVIPATGITLSEKDIIINEGETAVLKATVTPANSTDTVSWSSSDSSIAAVSGGTVTAKKSGSVTITAKTSNGKTASCNVVVLKPARIWTKENQYAFNNSSYNFTTGRYTMTDADFNKLSNYIKKQYNEVNAKYVIDSLMAERMNTVWGGSCYGMSVTALLDFEDRISMTENFDPDASNIYQVDSPRINPAVQSAINYYQLSQSIGFIGGADGAFYDKNYANWKEGLISLVAKAQEGSPVLFCYWFSRGGHAIIIKSYAGTDAAGNHRLVAYDNRYPDNDIYVVVDKNYSSCTVNGDEYTYAIQYLTDFSVYDKIDIDGPGNDMVIKNQGGGNINSGAPATEVSVTVDGDITIWDENDKYITIKDGNISGTMNITSTRMIVSSTADGNPAPVELVFTVDDSDSFTFETSGQNIKASVLSDDTFAEIDALNAFAATISEKDGVSVSGNNAAYTVHKSVEASDCEMFCFSGVSTGVSSVNYENGSIFVSGNNPGSINVGKFGSGEYEELTFETKKDKVSIKISSDADGYIPGDVDGNGSLSATDARLALRRSVDLEAFAENSKQFKAADVDKNGVVTATDARSILRASVGLEDLKK